MTNINELPVLSSAVRVGTNEDWRDAWVFQTAGSAVSYPSNSNVGNGNLGAVSVGAGTPLGHSKVEILSVGPTTVFGLSDLEDNAIGIGTVGVPFTAADFHFTVNQGSTAFVVGDTFTIAVTGQPIDVSGLFFSVTVNPPDIDNPLPLLTGSTDDSRVLNGTTAGTVSMAFRQSEIEEKLQIGLYNFDIVATAPGPVKKRVIYGTLEIVRGHSFIFGS